MITEDNDNTEGFAEDDGFGAAAYGGGQYAKEVTLKDGVSRFRILPPMKSLRTTRKWKVFTRTHFGYKGVNKRKKGGEPINRPYGCVEEKDQVTKMIKVQCPSCQKGKDQKDLYEARLGQLQAEGMSKEEAKKTLAPLGTWLREHNCDKKFKMAAINEKLEPVVLKLSYTTTQKLDNLFKKLSQNQSRPIDPTALNQGVWVEFTRTGEAPNVNDEVDVVKESINVPGYGQVEQPKLAPINAALAQQALEMIPDLNSTVKFLSLAQVELIVNGSQEPEDIDAVWAMGEATREATPAKAPSRPLPTPTTVPTTSAAENDEEAAIKARLAQIQAKREAAAREKAAADAAVAAAAQAQLEAAASTTAITPDPTPPKKAIDDMDDEEFMALINKSRS